MKKLTTLLTIALLAGTAYAQLGTPLVQYSGNQMFYNPGYAGIYDLLSINLNFRQSWVGLPGAPRLISFNGHAPFNNQKQAVGFIFQREEWGPSTGHFGYANYAHKIYFREHVLNLGVQAGFLNHITDWDKIEYVQHEGDPVLRSGRTNHTRFDLNVGAFVLGSTYYFGASVKHLMRPKYDRWTYPDQSTEREMFSHMPMNFYFIGGYRIELDEKWAIRPEAKVGVIRNMPIDVQVGAQASYLEDYFFGFAFGTGQKTASIILRTTIVPRFLIGYSYDIHYGVLGRYQRGSHEISVNYLLRDIWGIARTVDLLWL